MNLSTIRKFKNQNCKGVKGSYAKMRSACKQFVEKQVSKAKPGTKTKTRAEAMKKANQIIKSKCKV